MILRVGGQDISNFSNVNIKLAYNTVASTFSFDFQFSPDNAIHQIVAEPGRYKTAEIFHEGEKLITGTILTHSFSDQPEAQLQKVSGYSLPGVLEDCQIAPDNYPLQFNGSTLLEIANQLVAPFDLNVRYDSGIQDKISQPYREMEVNELQSIKKFLAELASQKNVNLSHNSEGNLVFREPLQSNTPAVVDFGPELNGVSYSLDFQGQKMHSDITVVREQKLEGGNAGQATVTNPFAEAYRPRVERQTSGDDIDTEDAAKSLLAEELRNIKFTISTSQWVFGGRLIRPGDIISLQADELYLYQKRNLFVEKVSLRGDATQQTATIECVLPEVYSQQEPVNIFI